MLTTFLASTTASPLLPLTPAALPNITPSQRPAKAVPADESALIAQAIEGSQKAYATLVRRYEQMVFSLALQMTNNRDDAHEVTQDAFLKAFRYLANYRGESRFSTWLYRIARTTALDHLRRRRLETISLDEPTSPVRLMTDATPNGYHQLVQEERTAHLDAAFQKLLPADNTVLTLFYLREQSLEEICDIMDWTMSNAKSRLCRARQRLREVLLEQFPSEFSDWT